jgi:hypothetical protein
MSTKKQIEVRAGEGLSVFFPASIKAAPGGRGYVLSGDEIISVDPADRWIAKRVRKGDLVVVKQSRAKAKPAATKEQGSKE